jgi:hypothetical protein
MYLNIPEMKMLHERLTTSYDNWIANAPESYKKDGFFTSRRPVGITSRFGQNQPLGASVQNAVVEDRNWDDDRPWHKLSHVTAALATHIRLVMTLDFVANIK